MAALEHFLANADGESDLRRADAAIALAELYLSADKPDRATALLRQALNHQPKNKKARRLLAATCQHSTESCHD